MGGAKKLHVGFPEKALDKYLSVLVDNGYRVAVIEQTETPKQLEQRVKKQTSGPKDKCVRREICNVYTKGTFKDSNTYTGYEPKFVLALKRHGNEIGVTFFDISTLKFYVG
jgi:DNA mismatch repair protein MSH6